MQRLRASKDFTYATRRLLPGDSFEASDRDARLLIAIKKARPDEDDPRPLRAPPRTLAKKIELFGGDETPPPAKTEEPEVDMAALREEYQEAVGRRAFHGWSADELRQRIAEAKADE